MATKKFSKLSWLKDLRGVKIPRAREVVLMRLYTYTGADGYGAHPGTERLAADACMNRRDLIRHLRALELDGWIVVQTPGGNQVHKGHATKYRLGCGRAPRAGHQCAAATKGGDSCTKGGDSLQARVGPTPTPSGHNTRSLHHSDSNESGPTQAPCLDDKNHGDENQTTNLPPSQWKSKSAEQQDEPRDQPDWEAMREDIELLEAYLEELGCDTYRHGALINSRWENEDHPKAIAFHVLKESGL